MGPGRAILIQKITGPVVELVHFQRGLIENMLCHDLLQRTSLKELASCVETQNQAGFYTQQLPGIARAFY